MASNDDVEPMVARLVGEAKDLMLVGHLPYLSRLVARLLGLVANRVNVQFQMAGVVRIDRDPGASEFSGGSSCLRCSRLLPELLRGFAKSTG
jgi:phosphohistidine phosphatase SixA